MTTKRKSIQTITDPLLEPYFITKDEYSFAVKQNVTSNADHFRSKGNSKTYEKSLFYYPHFADALQKIAKLKAENGDFDSLEVYIKNYELISNQIKIYTDELRSTI
jgi:hypothetical protein